MTSKRRAPPRPKEKSTKRTKPAAPTEKAPVEPKPGAPKGPAIKARIWEGHVSAKGSVRVWVAIPDEYRGPIMAREKGQPTFGARVRAVWSDRPSKGVPQSDYAGKWGRVAVYLPETEARALVAWEKESGLSFDLYLADRLLEEIGKK